LRKVLRKKRIRVLIAKPGLDGHDTGAKVVAYALRDAGMEVIYTGLHKSVEEIARAALQEDVDVIGLSIYSGAHLPLCKKLMERLKELNISEKMVLVGGNIPPKDVEVLLSYGVSGVFPVGSHLEEIIKFIEERVRVEDEG